MPVARMCPKCTPERILDVLHIRAETFVTLSIENCRGCRGVWLDGGEAGRLRRLQAVIPNAYRPTEWKQDLTPGRCPVCDERPELKRLSVGAFGVDRCRRCFGIWFDGGELGPMLTERGYDSLLKALEER